MAAEGEVVTIKVDGVPFKVRTTKGLRAAQKALAEAIRKDPQLLERRREAFLNTGGSFSNRLAIGAGKAVTEAGRNAARGVLMQVASANIPGVTGLAVEGIESLDKGERADAEALSRIADDNAVNIGEFLGDPLNAALGAGLVSGVARGGFALMRGITRRVMGSASEAEAMAQVLLEAGGLTVKEAAELAATQPKLLRSLGKVALTDKAQVTKAVEQLAKPSVSKATGQVVEKVAQKGAQGASQAELKAAERLARQRDAAVKIGKDFRAQGSGQDAALAELLAEQQAAALQVGGQAARQAGQKTAATQAGRAGGQTARAKAKANLRTSELERIEAQIRREQEAEVLRESIRRALTGQ